MDKKPSAKSAIKSEIKVQCSEEDRYVMRDNGFITKKVEVISFINLEKCLFENPEFRELYRSNSEFNKIVNCLREGITGNDMLSLFKDLCKINDTLRTELIKLIQNSSKPPIAL